MGSCCFLSWSTIIEFCAAKTFGNLVKQGLTNNGFTKGTFINIATMVIRHDKENSVFERERLFSVVGERENQHYS